MATIVPMAVGEPSPVWPLPEQATDVPTSGSRRFGASRKGGARFHGGIDLDAPERALVVAPESGTLVNKYKFNGPRAFALLLQTDSGIVINLGEVAPSSWREFGLDVGRLGSWVDRGDSVARVGVNPNGSTMLHFETYTRGTRANQQWFPGQDPPPRLLDPTNYLLEAAGTTTDPDDPIIPDVVTPDDQTMMIALGVGIPIAALIVFAATRPRKGRR